MMHKKNTTHPRDKILWTFFSLTVILGFLFFITGYSNFLNSRENISWRLSRHTSQLAILNGIRNGLRAHDLPTVTIDDAIQKSLNKHKNPVDFWAYMETDYSRFFDQRSVISLRRMEEKEVMFLAQKLTEAKIAATFHMQQIEIYEDAARTESERRAASQEMFMTSAAIRAPYQQMYQRLHHWKNTDTLRHDAEARKKIEAFELMLLNSIDMLKHNHQYKFSPNSVPLVTYQASPVF